MNIIHIRMATASFHMRTAQDDATGQEAGPCLTRTLPAIQDFRLLYTEYRPDRDLAEASRQQPIRPLMVLTFGLEGESAFRNRSGTELVFKPGHATLTAFRASDGARLYQGKRAVRQLRMIVPQDALAQYCEPGTDMPLPDTDILQLSARPLSSSDHNALEALLCQASRPRPDRLQLHILMLQLLAGQLPVGPAALDSQRPLGQRELDRIDLAYRLLAEELGQPLSITALAARVGLNVNKLRQGFAARFQASPGQVLLMLRMRKAQALLQAGCQVAEAAYAVGYGHPSNFSAAFSRFHGYPPKSVFKAPRSKAGLIQVSSHSETN